MNEVCLHGIECKKCTRKKLCEDENCDLCLQRSFASHPRSERWSARNESNPRKVFKSSGKKYWFDCDICSHSFEKILNNVTGKEGRWCPYCANQKLCEEECEVCFNKSFASFDKDKVRCWDSEKNVLKPRNVFKRTGKKFWFNCEKCFHSFEASLDSFSGKGSWCPYCGSARMCLLDCDSCFNKSFASHYRSKFWSKKNNCSPREIFKQTNRKYVFDCENCEKEFSASPNNVVGERWCPFCCESKGERKVSEELEKKGIIYRREKKFRGLKNKRFLRYDFYFVLEGKKCVVEYDGEQHFRENTAWTKRISFESQKKNDLIKTQFCYDKGISLLRIPHTYSKKIPDVLNKFIGKIIHSREPVFYFKNKELYSEHYSLTK